MSQASDRTSAIVESDVVVAVKNVSKIYDLWDSPRDRLMAPLQRIFSSLLPAFLRRKVQGIISGPRPFHALTGISFEIRKGESWGFIGVNGSGKSTLLRIISGNLRPSLGSVEVDGKVAILDYGSGFNTDFTGRENIYLKGALLGLSKRQIEQRVPAIVEFADIGEFIDQPAKTYSSGMTARLGFAIMAHVDANILITDEALAVGDAFFVQKCMRHIRGFLKQGTFLFVSHSVNDVMSLCDHAVWLEHGRVIQIGSARDVCLAYQASVERKSSQQYLLESEESGVDKSDLLSVSDNVAACAVTRPPARITLSREQLALLKHHYAPSSVAPAPLFMRTGVTTVCEAAQIGADNMQTDTGIGGGYIFSATITDQQQRTVTAVLGGELIMLTVRAVAEKSIRRPILGFQLKNSLGLTLVAENTFLAAREQDLNLEPGEVISATFCFAMPLLPMGEYVIRTGFADGVEDDNALIDVRHEALLLRCETSGARHGLVGVPMQSVVLERELPTVLLDAGVIGKR